MTPPASSLPRQKIVFLLNNAYGIGGTIRATANMSAALAERHSVEVVSVHRVLDRTGLPFDPRVRMTTLIDLREDSPDHAGAEPLAQQPCAMYHERGTRTGRLAYTALHDERIAAFLDRTDADIVVATRPILNGYLARYGADRYLRVGQEHLSYDGHTDEVRHAQNVALAGLDAFVTVSEADAARYRAELPQVRTRITCVPNGVPAPGVERSPLDSKVIVAAGRLIPVKRYDRLVDAFAEVAAEHPDWALRLYGRGPEKAALRERIDRLGLYGQVRLMGPVSPIETEWAKGAIAAVTSDMESFGMTVVEAMHCGVPVVATDCPHGPAEIITHERDGLLVPLEAGVAGYADALRRLMSDDGLRARLGAAALERARDFEPAAVALRYEELFRELGAGRERGAEAPAQVPEPSQRPVPVAAPVAPSFGARMWRRLRSAAPAPKAVAAPVPGAAPAAAAAAPVAPVAFARSTGDGGFTVRFDPATLPAGPLDFVARLRRDPKGREVRIAVPQDGEVVVAADAHRLAEGRWDCYVAPRGTDRRRRLECGLAERARRVGASPRTVPDGVAAWLPYATSDGFLALRAWLRPAHAEVLHVDAGPERAVVGAALYGVRGGLDGARVVAVARAGEERDFSVPVVRVTDEHFEFTLPYAEAAARRDGERADWTLWLHRSAAAAVPVPIGRIGSDVMDRNKTDLFPEGPDRVGLHFTGGHDLGVRARTPKVVTQVT
ncbi:glycosyltransferase family 4 protein [Streptomyces sp. NPDC050145]|uniref:glycosyltransferase family 4 protein n=1 Tax=Streptomyces sp. NPDC050145 TaxID=3365602 RepID=UPI0037B608FE